MSGQGGPPSGLSIPVGMTGPPPGVTGFPTGVSGPPSAVTGLPSGIPSSIITSGMTGPLPGATGIPTNFSGTPPLMPGGIVPAPGSIPPFILGGFKQSDVIALGKFSLAICWTTCVLALIVVVLRLFARRTKRGSAGWDDWTIVVAIALAIGGSVSNTFQGTCPKLSSCFGSATMSSEMLNFCSLCFMRLSVCIFVLRLLPPTSRYPKLVTYFAVFLNFATTVLCIATFAASNQFPKDRAPQGPRHNKLLNHAFIAGGILSAIIDFLVVLIPLLTIRTLQMKLGLKIGICLVISLSLFTASLSIGKVIATSQMRRDLPRNVLRIQIFSNLEQNLGIIFASCPALRQLYSFAETKIRSYKGNSRTAGSGSASGGSKGPGFSGGSKGSSHKPLVGGGDGGTSTTLRSKTRRSISTDTTDSIDHDHDHNASNPDHDVEKHPFSPKMHQIKKRTSIEILADQTTALGGEDDSQGSPEKRDQWVEIRAPSVVGNVDAEVLRGRERERERRRVVGLGNGGRGDWGYGGGGSQGSVRAKRSASQGSVGSWYRESRE